MKCKRLIASFLIIALCLLMLPLQVFAAETVASGTCGADLTWTLDSDGTLTISGSGPMEDYSLYPGAPWYRDYKDSIKSLVINEGVTSIGSYAFQSCKGLTEITIPEGVTHVGKEAFSFCSGMTKVTIPSSVTYIGEDAFSLCYRLESVYISDMDAWCRINFISEDSNPLIEADNLYLSGEPVTDVVIPEGVSAIAPVQFSFASLTSIQIPDSVKSIGESAFEGCSQLTSINLPAGVTEIGKRAFSNCNSLTGTVVIPDGVTEIGEATFYYCENLSGVVIPQSVTTIGTSAFSFCKNIHEITLPAGVTSIADSTFSFCTSLKSVSMPDGITSIGKEAFSYCSSFDLAHLPKSLCTLGESAFEYSGLTSVIVPAGVTSLPASVFADCENLTSVTLPDTLVSIGEEAFWHCKSLKKCTIPASVTSIGKEAFSFCYYLDDVEIPYGVTVIEDKTFYYCLGLTNIRIPGTVTSIGSQVFDNCSALSKVYFEGTEELWSKVNNQSSLGKAEIIYEPQSPEQNPDTPSGGEDERPLEQIASGTCGDNLTWVFDVSGTLTISGTGDMDGYANGWPRAPWDNYSKDIRQVVIKNGVTSIGNYAFCYSALTQIDIPNSVKYIGKGAFFGCNHLIRISIPEGVTTIEDSVFYSCRGLKTITLPSTVTSVEREAFHYASGLQDVYFGGSEEQWKQVKIDRDQDIYDTHPYNQPLLDATIHFDVPASARYAKMQVYSNCASLRVEIGETITFHCMMLYGEDEAVDPSGITFQFSDGYMIKVVDTGFDQKNSSFYVVVEGAYEGITSITFSDSTTGCMASLPITVIAENHETYTLDTIPKFEVFNGLRNEGPVNFYNANGLYVDDFAYFAGENGKTEVRFNVYNTNYTFGIVEVYDENGNLYNVVLLDKMDALNGSIKEVMFDGTGCFLRDLFKGTGLSYKQETNFSKRTTVEVEIPENGYIVITADPLESGILSVVNSADLLMSVLSLLGEADGYSNDSDFPEKLTLELFENTAYSHILKDGKKLGESIWKDIGKEATITSKTVGDFADTLIKNLTELNLMDIIVKNAKSTGVSIAENVFKELLGTFGDALDAMFLIGSVGDLARQYTSYLDTALGGSIIIQNQSGDKRHCNNIVLESEADFDPEVALQVYNVVLDDALLDKVKNADQETYDLLMKGVVRTYNISLVKNGEAIQHGRDVTVYIPIPDELESLGLNGHIKVFRIEEDGSVTDMDAIVEGDHIMFTTDHFSLYTIVGYEQEQTPDDPSIPGTNPTVPNEPDTDPDDKDDPSDDEDDDDDRTESPDGAGVVIVIVIVLAILAAGTGAALVIIKKKKKA